MAVYEKCPDCSGEIVVGIFEPIRVDKIGPDGQVVIGKDGKPEKVVLQLPRHRVTLPISEFKPTGKKLHPDGTPVG